MSRRTLIGGAAVVLTVIVIAALWWAFRSNDTGETATVERGELKVTIETVGQLRPRDPSPVRSTVSGPVQLVAVSVGDTVRQGDVLVQLDQEPFQAALQAAQEQQRSAETALNLAEQQAGQDQSPEQVAQRLGAEQQLRDADRAVSDAQQALESTLILAPQDGTVIDLKVSEGVVVGQGTEVAQVANLGDLELSIDLDEIDIPHVDTGLPVTFVLDAYPGTDIPGTLTRISPVATTSGGTTTFPATVSFMTPDGITPRPGMNANVSIETAVRENVLLVPEQALRTVGRRTFVTVVTDGASEEREIQTGLRSGGMVEVAGGLEEGDRVVLH